MTNFNFLGVIIDEHLNWNDHINKVATTISRCVGILCRLKHYLPLYTLRTLYTSLILPHLTYGILIWGSNISRLFKLQKRAVRTITNSSYNAHTEPIFKSLNLLKIKIYIRQQPLNFTTIIVIICYLIIFKNLIFYLDVRSTVIHRYIHKKLKAKLSKKVT